jgi:hypothetical protein
MLVPGSANPLLLRTVAAPSGGVSRSLRFSSGDSSYLSRTPASAGNRKTFTFATWIKRSLLSDRQNFFGTGDASFNYSFWIEFFGTTLRFGDYTTSHTCLFETSQVFRDPSSWGHVVIAFDTTQATDTNRVKVYWNGLQITAFSTASYPTQNLDTQLNAATLHSIGRAGSYNAQYFSGYLADTYFIDGQQLDPSSFTTTDATTGQLIPKAFSGSYGTNGFHLDFADNSAATATTLGKDTSGNGNNWTPNNLSVTAGAGNDSLVDVPVNGTASSGADPGGSTRGNYCTWNPTDTDGSVSYVNGNLEAAVTNGSANSTYGTFSLTSGKWYWEIVISGGNGSSSMIGVAEANKGTARRWTGANGWYYYETGVLYNNLSSTSYGSSYTNGDVIGVALDMDNGNLVFYKNNTSQGTAYSSGTFSGKTIMPAVGNGGSATVTYTLNAGARSFAYTAPSGYKALCTANLPAPLVTKPFTVMDVLLYTGNGSSRSITGLNFSPDFIWQKPRSEVASHRLADIVRGVNQVLKTNLTNAEATESGVVDSFDSNGFTGGGTNAVTSGQTAVAWCWDAGTSTVTNTQGSITSSVRANPTAGFSVVTYTASAGATIGHGLGAPPQLIIAKSRTSGSTDWAVYSSVLGRSSYLLLNGTSSAGTLSNYWGTADPTSTVFGVYSSTGASNNAGNMVAYCFAPVVGYSAMGSYQASSGLPFVYLGFKPKLLLIKNITSGSTNWRLMDSTRDTFNDGSGAYWLKPNTSDAEVDERPIDFLSNGFKLRMTDGGDLNYSSDTYIYCAFAESPFQYARAR